MSIILLTLLMGGQYPRPPQYPTPPPPVVSQQDRYAAAFQAARESGNPLVVFVRCEPFAVPGAMVARWDGYPNVDKPTVAVGVPDGAGGFRAVYLTGEVTMGMVQAALTLPPAGPQFNPSHSCPECGTVQFFRSPGAGQFARPYAQVPAMRGGVVALRGCST